MCGRNRGAGLLFALAFGAILVGLASIVAVMIRQRVAQLQRTQWAVQARLNAHSGLAPQKSCHGDKHPYLKVKIDYYSDGLRYRLLVRAFDKAYPKGRIVRLEEGEGWLPEANITYGVGLPVAGNWRLQEKIDGVETECLTLQSRQIAVGVESPNLLWLDNQSQVYHLNLFSGPSNYKVKNFTWTLELRNSATQELVRSYTGEVSGNTQNALRWEQVWDGNDQQGAPVALGTSVTAQMRVEIPKDPTEANASFDETLEQFRREIHNVPQRCLAPSRFHNHSGRHDAYHPGQAQTVASGQQDSGPAGGAGDTNPTGRFFMLTGFDQTKGVSHRAKLAVFLPATDAELRMPGAGRLVFESSTVSLVRVEEQPIRIDTLDGNPPKYWRIEFRDGNPVVVTDGIPVGGFTCGDWGDMYLRASDGSYVQKVIPSKSDFANYWGLPPIPQNACVILAWVTLFHPDTPLPQASAISPPGQPTPVVSASGLGIQQNYMGLSGGPVSVGMDVSSGLYSHSETDLAVKTRGIPAVMSRYWHSGGDGLTWGTIYPNTSNLFRSQFGWIWNFQRELNFAQGGTICKLVKPEGGADAFQLNGSGGWDAVRSDMTDRLTQLDPYRFQIETKDHFFYVFKLPDQIQHTSANARAFLVQERDMHNNQLNYEWDIRGDRLQTIREGTTNRVLMTLEWGTGAAGSPDAWLQLRSVRDFTGRTVTYTHQQAPAPYQNQGYLSEVRQPGNVTLSYRYNSLAVQKAQPGALNVPPALLSSAARQTFYQNLANYDLSVSLREVLRNNISQSTFSNADPKGAFLRETNHQNLMTYRRELSSPIPEAQVRLLQIPQAAPNDRRAFDYKFSASGRPTDIWDSQGNRRRFEFDPATNLRKYVSALNQESTFSFDARRNLIQATDSAQNVYRFTFDGRDRLTEIRNPLNGVVRCTYNALDELTRIEDEDLAPTAFTYSPTGKVATMTNALSHTWTYQYDGRNFLARVIEPSVGGLQPIWDFTTDNLGRVISESSQGVPLNETTYDERDRVTSTTLLETNFPESLPVRRTSRYSYNNFDQLVSATDPLQRVTRMEFDTNQRYIRTVRPDGTTLGRTYDAQGDVVSHFNGAGFSTTYQFDSMHRITRMTHPGTGGSELFGYDAKGRLASWHKTDNSVVSYQYDILDRIIRIYHQGAEKVRYAYDSLGRVTRMDDQVGPTRYSYSPGSDLLRVEDGLNRALAYAYDPANQLLTRTDQENVQTQFVYNARGQVSQAIHDGLIANYQYNALGAPTQVSWNNGLNELYQYSTQGEAMRRTVTFPGRTLEAEAVERDALGRKSQAVFTLPGSQRTHSYTYNLIGQLTGSTRRLQPSGGPQTSQTYGYDNADNRLRNGTQASAFNPADQLTAVTGAATTPNYFSTGSLQRDPQNGQYSYDWREQLSNYQRGSTTASYAHNGNNLRMEKRVNGVSTQYLWDGAEVLKEYSDNGTVKASYFLGATGRQAIKVDGAWYIYLRDTQGSMTGLVDLAGNRVATYESDPYGEPIVDQGTIYNPYRWNGEPLDAESGLTYMRNRYYQASTGRFIQRDPISYAGGLNLYAFPTDPVNSFDPSGLFPVKSDWIPVYDESGGHAFDLRFSYEARTHNGDWFIHNVRGEFAGRLKDAKRGSIPVSITVAPRLRTDSSLGRDPFKNHGGIQILESAASQVQFTTKVNPSTAFSFDFDGPSNSSNEMPVFTLPKERARGGGRTPTNGDLSLYVKVEATGTVSNGLPTRRTGRRQWMIHINTTGRTNWIGVRNGGLDSYPVRFGAP